MMKMNSSCRGRRVLLVIISFGLFFMKPTEAGRTIIDITHTYNNIISVWGDVDGSKPIIHEQDGHSFQTGEFTLGTHWGTHVDSPQHLLSLKKNPISAINLDLQTLIGPVLVVRIPTGVRNINAQVLRDLDLPIGLERVIFKTDNTDRRLMNQIPFEWNYTGLVPDAAAWLAQNTTLKFIGLDYMSVAAYDYVVPVHDILLNKPGVIPVECLNLEGVEPGYYDVYCLPIKVAMEAAPVRCILMK
ncbi:OLC1v1003330C1 [Oldenlandia corymbosa var. corymbosa]|uniref:OLC1v1003330C1 n=1 Tax=Oldenlandia corymbosa var. corymbosa TaxID=529605 RepID=A0AAV1D9U9_OLDCO|nr:OLC1v1003330C1 [Oldenlandia corymbosa var. corymbosa]